MEYEILNYNKNNYIIIDNLLKDKEQLKRNKRKLQNELCDKCNGIIFLENIIDNYVKISIYNSDFSICKISGDAICSVVTYLYENKIINNDEIFIETLAGIIAIKIELKNQKIQNIIMNLGKPSFSPQLIPVLTEKNIFINENIEVLNKKYKASSILIGNPYTVIYENKINNIKLDEIGPLLAFNYKFPLYTNIVFAKKINDKSIMIRIWGRENKELTSCSSAAAASVVIGVLNNEINKNEDIDVYQKNGKSIVKYNNDDEVFVKQKILILKNK